MSENGKANVPLISVVIPTYNRGALLGRSIRSVLGQSYGNIEVIVVDDASIDDTNTIVEGFSDERLSYIRHDKNKGGAEARNTGIRATKGKYIAFQDSDDEWVPDKLEKQMQVFGSAGNEISVVYCGFFYIRDGVTKYMPPKTLKKKEGAIFEQLLSENFVSTQTLLVKREVFDKVGMFDVRLPRYHDWELAIRMAEQYDFGFVNEPLVLVHAMPVSITADGITRVKAREIILEKHYNRLREFPPILARHLRDLGHFKCLYDSCKSGRVYLMKAIRKNPTDGPAWLSYLLSFLGQEIYRKIYFSVYKRESC
jgi:glycosyltransferase involved in cell wall biosynthesis